MYVARDENNYLYLYTNKPKKSSDGYWYSEKGDVMDISDLAFPEVKWSDEEPRELILKPIKEEQP